MGKAAEVVGPRGYKKAWQGLPLHMLSREESTEESPAITSFKTHVHKALFRWRNESFRMFTDVYQGVASEFENILSEMKRIEEQWSEEWEKKVQYLKSKAD